ncbi:hypothetical protein F2P47_06830 [Parvibaculum sedimenti]|uniref:Uncharacterized protein n=1 Tax=Parvibaculum sedimenti TaxID=2608632 RepID=A0A6N6VPD8_9HYPH|nr:hypothetical protein [Parvibaculum sedimenti]KAB7740754.1 hypothetical protein F2P47_06830 [Parvibaculum sedimenti]
MEVRSSVAEPAWTRGRLLSWIYGGAGIFAVALLLRYALIEPHSIGLACGEVSAPWWCTARQGIVWLHIAYVWGGLGLAGGLAAMTRAWSKPVRLGLLAFALAVVAIYNIWPNVGIHALWIWACMACIAALLVFLANERWTIVFALTLSIFAVVLYNSDYGAVGLALTLLRLPRV